MPAKNEIVLLLPEKYKDLPLEFVKTTYPGKRECYSVYFVKDGVRGPLISKGAAKPYCILGFSELNKHLVLKRSGTDGKSYLILLSMTTWKKEQDLPPYGASEIAFSNNDKSIYARVFTDGKRRATADYFWKLHKGHVPELLLSRPPNTDLCIFKNTDKGEIVDQPAAAEKPAKTHSVKIKSEQPPAQKESGGKEKTKETEEKPEGNKGTGQRGPAIPYANQDLEKLKIALAVIRSNIKTGRRTDKTIPPDLLAAIADKEAALAAQPAIEAAPVVLEKLAQKERLATPPDPSVRKPGRYRHTGRTVPAPQRTPLPPPNTPYFISFNDVFALVPTTDATENPKKQPSAGQKRKYTKNPGHHYGRPRKSIPVSKDIQYTIDWTEPAVTPEPMEPTMPAIAATPPVPTEIKTEPDPLPKPSNIREIRVDITYGDVSTTIKIDGITYYKNYHNDIKDVQTLLDGTLFKVPLYDTAHKITQDIYQSKDFNANKPGKVAKLNYKNMGEIREANESADGNLVTLHFHARSKPEPLYKHKQNKNMIFAIYENGVRRSQ